MSPRRRPLRAVEQHVGAADVVVQGQQRRRSAPACRAGRRPRSTSSRQKRWIRAWASCRPAGSPGRPRPAPWRPRRVVGCSPSNQAIDLAPAAGRRSPAALGGGLALRRRGASPTGRAAPGRARRSDSGWARRRPSPRARPCAPPGRSSRLSAARAARRRPSARRRAPGQQHLVVGARPARDSRRAGAIDAAAGRGLEARLRARLRALRAGGREDRSDAGAAQQDPQSDTLQDPELPDLN